MRISRKKIAENLKAIARIVQLHEDDPHDVVGQLKELAAKVVEPNRRSVNMALKKWVCEYECNGAKYCLHFDTYDYEDPEERIKGIRESLVLLGELGGIIPADSGQSYDSA